MSNRERESADLEDFINKERSGCIHQEMAGRFTIFQDRNDMISMPKSVVKDKSCRATRQLSSAKQKTSNIIIIEDDDDVEIENAIHEVERWDENFDSDAGSRKLPSCYYTPTGWHSANDYSVSAPGLSDSSEEEDCFVLEPGPSRMVWQSHKRVLKAEKRPVYELFDTRDIRSNSSDCEIIENLHGKGCQGWEEGAFQKGVANALNIGRYRVESEESTSALNHTKSAKRRRGNGKLKGQDYNIKMNQHEQSEASECGRSIPMTPLGSEPSKEKTATPIVLDQPNSSHNCPDRRTEDVRTFTGEEIYLTVDTSRSSGNDVASFGDRVNGSHSKSVLTGSTGDFFSSMSPPLVEVCHVPQVSSHVGDDHVSQRLAAERVENPLGEGLIIDRERLKVTEEFQKADEEEWARRQLELQRQVQEAQRLRKRKKVEAQRRIEMENRQKQRLEEIRYSLQKEEQNLGYKEQVRGQIRSELEHVATTCIDMATLLRRLGIQVDGGAYPTDQQVNAAYRRALLCFHPDRVAATDRSDPSRQVKAEETFKLILKMKNTLQSVALGYF